MASDLVWSFGYGSNMDVAALTKKKKIPVTEHTAAILYDYKLGFTLRAMPYVEPSFANVESCPGEEVHGVAFCMSKESMLKLDKMESGYLKKMVDLKSYDGRDLNGFVYIKETDGTEVPTSARYLGVLCKGARQAGLKADYIEALSKRPTYTPPEHILRVRAARPQLDSLPPITLDELKAKRDIEGETWVSCMGYVVRHKVSTWMFPSHKYRDVTARNLMHYNGISLDDNDNGGYPPYPLLQDMSPGELEYVTMWLDFYQCLRSKDGISDLGEIVGYHKEFLDQQKSGKTEFVLPPKPTI